MGISVHRDTLVYTRPKVTKVFQVNAERRENQLFILTCLRVPKVAAVQLDLSVVAVKAVPPEVPAQKVQTVHQVPQDLMEEKVKRDSWDTKVSDSKETQARREIKETQEREQRCRKRREATLRRCSF